MDLQSGHLFWPQTLPQQEIFAPLLEDAECDVAILGGGVTGALVAYHLATEGIRTIVLDKRQPGCGSTAASTALLLYELDVSLSELMQQVGVQRAVRAWELCRTAIASIKEIVTRLGDDCGFVPRASLYLASREKDVAALREEYQTRRKFGFELDWLERADIAARYSFQRPAALLTPEGGVINPFRFTRALLDAAIRAEARVHGDTEVTSVEHDKHGVLLRTRMGRRVTARKVVYATGYETQQYLPQQLIKLVSSYAIATTPLDGFAGWPGQCLIWETARPYLYLRTTEDGRAVVGGVDEPISNPQQRDALLPEKAVALHESFQTLFPQAQTAVAYAWAGFFGESEDSMPYIGTIPDVSDAYFSLSYGANGVIFALLAAEMMRDLFLGHRHEGAQVFGFDRLS